MRYSSLSNVTLILSAVLVAASVFTLFVPGPQLSIEFTGGTLMELNLPAGKTEADLRTALAAVKLGDRTLSDASLTSTKTNSVFVRVETLSNEEHQAVLSSLKKSLGDVQELQYTTIGPTVGQNLKTKALWALVLACVAIIVYIAFAFRQMPGGISPWSFGICAVAALAHDTLLTVGVFTILSRTTTFQMDLLFVTALMSIMGNSVNDTIVIFDRARAILKDSGRKVDFEEAVVMSLKQSVIRTVNMGIAVLIMLFALFLLGSESIRWFMLALIVGTVIGNYSSYFVATPLLLFWRRLRLAKR